MENATLYRSSGDLAELAALMREKRGEILADWMKQVREIPSAQSLDVPTLHDHIPGLIDELAAELLKNSDETIPEALNSMSATAHGLQRVQDAFDIEEVVAEYNVLRGCIHTMAEEHDLNLQGQALHIINRVFDQAIGTALQTYSTQRALEIQKRREEYLAFVAHDLRTPLNAIALAGRILETTTTEDGANAVTSAQMLTILRRNVKLLEGLVGKVLDENTNLQTEIGIKLERREFYLWPLVESLIHDLRPVAGTASTLLLNKVPDDLIVYADAGLLRRIFQNLIANAIKYTPRGEIAIEARESENGDVDCRVSDNGEGIPAELLDKVFDKGEADPGSAGGTGLGLAIVKTYVEAHGGTVVVKSKVGVGSVFQFSLPGKAAEST